MIVCVVCEINNKKKKMLKEILRCFVLTVGVNGVGHKSQRKLEIGVGRL